MGEQEEYHQENGQERHFLDRIGVKMVFRLRLENGSRVGARTRTLVCVGLMWHRDERAGGRHGRNARGGAKGVQGERSPGAWSPGRSICGKLHGWGKGVERKTGAAAARVFLRRQQPEKLSLLLVTPWLKMRRFRMTPDKVHVGRMS
jgi:hypothetical protein